MWVLTAAALLTAALVWAEPARVGCGPAQAGCGPAAVQTVGAAPSGTPAPSWVSVMLAAWMLDEASGTRVNAQGTTARDLSVVDGTDPTNSIIRMEGAASAVFTALQGRHTVDTFAALPASPIVVGCWVNSVATGGPDFRFLLHDATGSFAFQLRRTASGYDFRTQDTSFTEHRAISGAFPAGVWAHVVGTIVAGTMTLYVNGTSAASTTSGTAAARSQVLMLGDNQSWSGQLDECFVGGLTVSAASVCRICSCGIRGEQCTCSGTAFASAGRNATACGSCTLPADCSAASPS